MSGEAYRRRLRDLLRLAGIRRVVDPSPFEKAFVHQSYAKERGGGSNERMEFLGDSILGCITAAWLYEQFAEEPEGALTLRKAAIVNDATLAQSARRLGFSGLLRLGAGMRSAGGTENTSVLADAFEAFVGALYLRYGLEKARDFVLTQHVAALDHSFDSSARFQNAPAALRAGTSFGDPGLSRIEPRHAAASGLQLARQRRRQSLGQGERPVEEIGAAGRGASRA